MAKIWKIVHLQYILEDNTLSSYMSLKSVQSFYPLSPTTKVTRLTLPFYPLHEGRWSLLICPQTYLNL